MQLLVDARTCFSVLYMIFEVLGDIIEFNNRQSEKRNRADVSLVICNQSIGHCWYIEAPWGNIARCQLFR